jgi:hypothetical protein
MCRLVASSPEAFVVSAQASPLNRSSVPSGHCESKRCVTVRRSSVLVRVPGVIRMRTTWAGGT